MVARRAENGSTIAPSKRTFRAHWGGEVLKKIMSKVEILERATLREDIWDVTYLVVSQLQSEVCQLCPVERPSGVKAAYLSTSTRSISMTSSGMA